MDARGDPRALLDRLFLGTRRMEKKSIKVLLVGGNSEENGLYPIISSDTNPIDVAWTHAHQLSEAIQRLSVDGFDLILLDFALPDSQPAEAVAQIQSRAIRVPMILLVDSDDQAVAA